MKYVSLCFSISLLCFASIFSMKHNDTMQYTILIEDKYCTFNYKTCCCIASEIHEKETDSIVYSAYCLGQDGKIDELQRPQQVYESLKKMYRSKYSEKKD